VSTGEVKDGPQCFMEYLLGRRVGTTHDEVQELGVMPSIMNEYQIAATLAQAKIGIAQWREIVKCLKSYMGLEKICVAEKEFRRLGDNHGEINHGVYEYEKDINQKCNKRLKRTKKSIKEENVNQQLRKRNL